jgi:hypothetical protein
LRMNERRFMNRGNEIFILINHFFYKNKKSI